MSAAMSYPWTRFPLLWGDAKVLQYVPFANYYPALDGLLEVAVVAAGVPQFHVSTAWQDPAGPGGWSGWIGVGDVDGGADLVPEIVGGDTGGQISLFIFGNDDQLWTVSQDPVNPANWNAAVPLGAPAPGLSPKVVFASTSGSQLNIISLFTIGYNDGALWTMWPDSASPTGWSDWVSLGSPPPRLFSLDSFCVGPHPDGSLEAFFLGLDGSLWHAWTQPTWLPPSEWQDVRTDGGPDSGWSSWVPTPTSAGSPQPTFNPQGPSFLGVGSMITNSDANGNLEVYLVDNAGSLWGRGQTGQVPLPQLPVWSDWVNLGSPGAGIAAGPGMLTAGRNADGDEDIAVITTDQHVWRIYNDIETGPGVAGNVGLLSSWSPREQVGPDTLSNVQMATNPDGRLELFAIDATSGQLCHVWELGVDIDEFVGCCYANLESSDPGANDDVQRTNWGIVDSTTSGGRLFAPILFQPTDVYGIAKAIIQAETDGQPARALGSGWSFSDASFPQISSFTNTQFIDDILTDNLADLWLHAGYAIDVSACSDALPLSSVLLSDVDSSLLWFTEAGITIAELNDTLARLPSPLALKTMGGSSGQTLAGAIATGTHGSDFDRLPLADQVRAMYIVGAGGIHHWVEPSQGITDPSQVAVTFPCIAPPNIHYDDDLFRSALVSMGSMRVVYAAIIDVVPQYALAQVTFKTVWEDLTGLVSGANSLFADNWAYRAQLDALFDQPPTYRALQLLVNLQIPTKSPADSEMMSPGVPK